MHPSTLLAAHDDVITWSDFTFCHSTESFCLMASDMTRKKEERAA
jgi:hypothetical protein